MKIKKSTLVSILMVIAIIITIGIGKSNSKIKQNKLITKALQSEKQKKENTNDKEKMDKDINASKTEVKEKNVGKKKEEPKRSFEGIPLKGNERGVPIIYYHSVDDSANNNELIISKGKFRSHMQYLKDMGYTTLTIDELYDYIKNNVKIPEKSVLISFDDGYRDNYTNAYPILKEFGYKATIFVITDMVDNHDYYLTSAQIKEMSQNGIDIQSHTTNHKKLGESSKVEQLEALKNSKESLEKILNKKIEFIAYPYGNYNNNTIEAVKEAGYKMAFTTKEGWGDVSDNIYKIDRVYISAFADKKTFINKLTVPQNR